MSGAQLLWVFNDMRRRRAERDLRALCLAAAGQSGKGFECMVREIKNELRGLKEDGGSRMEDGQEPRSETPLSAEDFARMMKDER